MTLKRNNRINREQPKAFFWLLLLVICFGLFSYGYLVRAAIVNIVIRQGMEKELSALSSKVTYLESEYVRAKNSVTIQTAESSGFVAVSNQKFITKSDKSTAGLSVNIR